MTPNGSRTPSRPGWPCKAHCRRPLRRMNLRPPQPILHRPNRPQHQLTPSSHCGKGGAPERSKPRPSHLPRLRSHRSQPSTTVRRLRHIIKPTLLPPKSKKVSSRSASRVGIATKAISSSLHHSRVWFAGEAPPTPTICGSPSPAQWDSRSATSSPYHSVEPITGTTIALATSRFGGASRLSIPSGRHGSSGFRHGASNECDRNLLLSLRAVPSTLKAYNGSGCLKRLLQKGWLKMKEVEANLRPIVSPKPSSAATAAP